MKIETGFHNAIQKSILLAAICGAITTVCYSQQNKAIMNTPMATQKGYAPVNGLNMYYEVYGEGIPVVLLHGAFMTINTNFGTMIPELSKSRKVIAVELQGHGHTADIDRPLSPETMADDVAGLLQYLKITSTDILGYSLGGEVALQVAIRHPEVVRRMIVVSAPYKSEGWSPETKAVFPRLNAVVFNGTPIKKDYDSIAPDPKHFPVLVSKIKELTLKPFDFTAEKIKAIKNPTLIIIADGDGILPEHAVEMYRLLGGKYMVDFGAVHKTQLAVFPGSSHISVMMHTDWMLSMTTAFLDTPVK